MGGGGGGELDDAVPTQQKVMREGSKSDLEQVCSKHWIYNKKKEEKERKTEPIPIPISWSTAYTVSIREKSKVNFW